MISPPLVTNLDLRFESFLFCQSKKIIYIYIYIIRLFYSLVRSFNFYGYQGIVDENRLMKLFREDFSPKLARNYNDCSAVIIVCLHYSRIFVFAYFS